jgi:hypothetical protein
MLSVECFGFTIPLANHLGSRTGRIHWSPRVQVHQVTPSFVPLRQPAFYFDADHKAKSTVGYEGALVDAHDDVELS